VCQKPKRERVTDEVRQGWLRETYDADPLNRSRRWQRQQVIATPEIFPRCRFRSE
jgi:hypothetical protein